MGRSATNGTATPLVGLTREQQAALEVLVPGGTVTAAAGAAAMARTTMHRWLRDLELRARGAQDDSAEQERNSNGEP